MGSKKQTWLAFTSGKPPSACVDAWDPWEFDWDLLTLHQRLKELKRVKVVYAMRPGVGSASQPEVLFDQLPLPLLSEDSHVLETFGNALAGFALTPVKTGSVDRGRYLKWGNALVPVPTPQVMYAEAKAIPQSRHFAVINGHFCVSQALVTRHKFYFRCVEFTPLTEAIAQPRPHSEDCSSLFVARQKVSAAELQAQFNDWLDGALSQPIPPKVVAFSFNLAEPWSIEVVGADHYSASDDDWACDESFRPNVARFDLTAGAGYKTWKAALKATNDLLTAYLDRRSGGSALLKRAKAVAVGFVDGDLEKVWPRE